MPSGSQYVNPVGLFADYRLDVNRIHNRSKRLNNPAIMCMQFNLNVSISVVCHFQYSTNLCLSGIFFFFLDPCS